MKQTTMLITRKDIEKVFNMKEAIEAVEHVFKLYGENKVQMPPKVYLTFEKGDLRSMPAYIPELNLAGVKNVNVHPSNKGIPTVMATFTLVDTETGFPLAIMDATHITNMRTGAAGAIAAKYLSKEDSKTAGFIGTGIQAETQLQALMITRPGISKIFVFDADKNKSMDFAKKAEELYSINSVIAESIEEVGKNADIIATTTPVRTPIVKATDIAEGTHINAIGADAEGKQELESSLIKKAKIVIDNWTQASHSGEINVPVSEGVIKREDIYADIGEIASGKKPGRNNPNDITIFDSTGLAVQDLACAAKIYKIFMEDSTLSKEIQTIDFLSS